MDWGLAFGMPGWKVAARLEGYRDRTQDRWACRRTGGAVEPSTLSV